MLRCDHCLLEFPEREAVREEEEAGAERAFCCQGCRGAWRLIHGEGLDRFYRERRWDEPGPAIRPGEALPDASAFQDAVREAGAEREVDLYLDGIRCASCVWLNERVLARTPGVSFARVSYATHRARVRFDPRRTSLESVLRRIAAIGYQPKPFSEDQQALARRAETRDLLIRLGTAFFLSSQLMIYQAALYAGYFQGIEAGTRRLLEVIALGLTLPAVLYSGVPFLKAARAGLRHGRFGMDSLVALGSLSALGLSLWQMARGGEVYFDTAAMIVTLILAGRYVESRAKGRASEAVARLGQLLPREARLVAARPGGGEERRRVPVERLRPGDLVEVVPAERLPADGLVVRGESEVDESLVTGESRPVAKTAGAAVIGGSLNLHGTFALCVTRAGKETVLAGIARAVEEAQASKPRLQAFADRVVGIFVPAILALAALTVAAHLWRGAPPSAALMTGVSVVVIACPCALGLATPLAVLLATGLASARGILVKGADALERAARCREAMLDKTGTVTRGRPELREVAPLHPSLGRDQALRLAAALERGSEHSLARAVLEAERRLPPGRDLSASGFRVLPGRGVEAQVDGEPALLGSRALLAQAGVAVPDGGAAAAAEARGETVVWLARGGRLLAFLAVADAPRPGAERAVRDLESLGMEVTVASGDAQATTAAVASALGVAHLAELGPAAKREAIARRQAAGRCVLFAGDGLNDAPALSQADVGVAVGRGTDVTLESADAVLVRDDLSLLPDLVKLSRRADRVIRQNIFWAFFYNVVAVPLAMAGWLHPIVAAAAMAASSLFVVGNSLRIRKALG
ncbi:MAG TPA: heavy metal translocating P-type ATPase metal-binding domain-containing protein [Anaeromyxobacteraceae bacterium]|nr:heavy metal translocating P-type ATPase metal-binding domain-containing protein [Anaeromyxobacteraceae bacterium]